MIALPTYLRAACEDMAEGQFARVDSSHVRDLVLVEGWRLISDTVAADVSNYEVWYRAEYGQAVLPAGTFPQMGTFV